MSLSNICWIFISNPFLDQVERAVVVTVFQLAEQAQGAAIEGAWVSDYDGDVPKGALHVVQDVVDAHEGVNLAHAGDDENVAQLVRRPVDGGDESLGRRNALDLLQQAFLTPLLLLGWELLEDSFRVRNVQQDVVEVPLVDLGPELALAELARICIGDEASEEVARFELEGGVVTEREDAGLVSKALVGEEVRITKPGSKGCAALLEVLPLHWSGHLRHPLDAEGSQGFGIAFGLDCFAHVEVEEDRRELHAPGAGKHAAFDEALSKDLLDLADCAVC